MAPKQEIVITGIGAASPIGIEIEEFWDSLSERRSGVRKLDTYDDPALPIPIGGEVKDFQPKRYVRPRKSLKVMSRDIQLAFAAADLAAKYAQLAEKPVDPERLGVVFGAQMIGCDVTEMVSVYRNCLVDEQFDFTRWGEAAMAKMYPLWMLKYLPNMPACHIGIGQDARGPNNSLTLGHVSSLAALVEATRVVDRNMADAIITGGIGTEIDVVIWGRNTLFGMTKRTDDPEHACRPFDATRDGMVGGEGAGAFVLETQKHAEARGVEVLARILGFASRFEPRANGSSITGAAIRNAITAALDDAGLKPDDIGHVNAHGASTVEYDAMEAAAIRDTLGDVPVTAPKSFFGDLGAGAGAVEMLVSVLGLNHGVIPPTLNYETPDPNCPINVIHGEPMPVTKPTALMLNYNHSGNAVAVIIGK